MTVSKVKACQIVVRIMSLNKFYSEFAPVTRIKIPYFPRPYLIFTSHTWRHEMIRWCITLWRISVMFKIETLGWFLNIIQNYERFSNQITHSFGRLKNVSKNFCPSLYVFTIRWCCVLCSLANRVRFHKRFLRNQITHFIFSLCLISFPHHISSIFCCFIWGSMYNCALMHEWCQVNGILCGLI